MLWTVYPRSLLDIRCSHVFEENSKIFEIAFELKLIFELQFLDFSFKRLRDAWKLFVKLRTRLRVCMPWYFVVLI